MNSEHSPVESCVIGVLCKQAEKILAREFFQFFKVPWEYYTPGKRYAAVICSDLDAWQRERTAQRVFIVFSSSLGAEDGRLGIHGRQGNAGYSMRVAGDAVPIYGSIRTLEPGAVPADIESLATVSDGTCVGLALRSTSGVVLRLGYDLFQEMAFLLIEGQPPENAHIPTLDLHVDFLRSWIIREGITLVEMPPTPPGYRFICCLTHDVDFAAVRHHFLDGTFFGFLSRASIGSVRRFVRGDISLRQVAENWLAIASLPFVYVGLAKDFWDPFDRYLAVEKGDSSTFFIVPFKNTGGRGIPSRMSARRRTRYDCDDIKSALHKLLEEGKEVGVHGLDAWHDAARGALELARITSITGQGRPGIRMHWLCFNRDSWQRAEEAGYRYDSTFGYNEAVGFRAGTLQPYIPPGAERILEVPLHIQDTALFYRHRLNLTKEGARKRCAEILSFAGCHGGVVTILWHDRSLAPERQWGWLYEEMLTELRSGAAWITSAQRAVGWFEARRSVRFVDAMVSQRQVTVRLSGPTIPELGLEVRVYPGQRSPGPRTSAPAYTARRYCGEDALVVMLEAC